MQGNTLGPGFRPPWFLLQSHPEDRTCVLTELTVQAVRAWLPKLDVKVQFIEPRKSLAERLQRELQWKAARRARHPRGAHTLRSATKIMRRPSGSLHPGGASQGYRATIRIEAREAMDCRWALNAGLLFDPRGTACSRAAGAFNRDRFGKNESYPPFDRLWTFASDGFTNSSM